MSIRKIFEEELAELKTQLVEYGNTDDIFTSPKDERTERYITGRFG